MKRLNKKSPSVKKLMFIYTAFFTVAMLLFIGVTISTTLMILNEYNKTLFLVGMITLLVLLLAVAIGFVFTIINVYKVFYKGLFLTSKDIIDDIASDKNSFQRYPEHLTEEFNTLNDSLAKTENRLNNLVIYSKNANYSQLNLEYSNKALGVIGYKFFANKITDIVLLSGAYRNAFIRVSYGDKLSSLTGLTQEDVINNIRHVFDYENMLIADVEDLSGYYVFIPQIDSLSRLKEEAENFIKSSSMMKRTSTGTTFVSPKISCVVYPFSDIEDILSDLKYASRQGKPINFFLPDRLNKASNKQIMHGSLALNRANQLISNLASLKAYENHSSNLKANITKQLKAFAAFINADYAGMIIRDDKIDHCMSHIALNFIEEAFVNEGDIVPSELLDAVSKVADADGTYYYSTRKHLSQDLARYIDNFHLSSGFLYVFRDEKGPLGIVYFANRDKVLNLDSYLRESAFAVSYQAGAIVRTANQESRIRDIAERSDIVMKLSNMMLYGVDHRNFEIQYTSETFKDVFGSCEKQKCYQALYGLEKPCEHCPLLTSRKMISEYKNKRFETSLSLKGSRENVSRMLMKRIDESSMDHNRFDESLLINSHYALYEDLQNLYLANGKGYVLLLSVENNTELLQNYGNEGFMQYLRKFTDALCQKLRKTYRFYAYNNSTIAMIIPNIGRTDIIDISEKIFEVSKNSFFELDGIEFKPLELNYIAVKYPQEYATHNDLFRHIESVITSYDHSQHIDQIYFESYEYFRSASRRAFINEVIDQSFKENTFKVKLQPMINSLSKQVVGAELLIRLHDDYRNIALNPDEVIRIAAEEGKISLISDALIHYIGSIYQNYGSSLFKQHGFVRLSINTDYSYFTEKDFVQKFQSFLERYELKENFIAFEINEKDLREHYDFFKETLYKIKQIGIRLVADQYTGEYVSIDKLKSLAISEIKIPRSIVNNIDVNKEHLEQVTELLKSAGEYGIKTSVVGIENKDQYFLIRDMEKQTYMQGYYFHAPLELNELIQIIKQS